MSGEQIFGTWKLQGNADQKELHGIARAIKIVPNSNNPMNMSKLAGKLIEVTGRYDGRVNTIISSSNITVIGSCLGVSFTGCFVDGSLLVTQTTIGTISIVPKSWDQIYAADVKYDKKTIDVAPFEGNLIRIMATGMEGSDRIESITASPAPGIETVGTCDPMTGILAIRASQLYTDKADWYIQKKDWQKALLYIEKSIALTPKRCWAYKKRKDIYLALGNVENAIKDLQYFIETPCATSADREEIKRLRSHPEMPWGK